MDINLQLQEKVCKLFEDSKIDLFIGYEQGSLPYKARPCFITRKEDAGRLIFNQYCINNLSIYLKQYPDKKIGILAHSCVLRSIIALVQGNQVKLESLYIIAVHNTHELPKFYQDLIGEESVSAEAAKDEYEFVREFEKLPSDKRWEYLENEFKKCIRCYACRNVCPICYCKECVVDKTMPQWVSKLNQSSTNEYYSLMRVFHVMGRCIDCGECERVCPVKIPLRLLLKKMEKEIEEMYGYKSGKDPNIPPPLSTFKEEDLEEGIK